MFSCLPKESHMTDFFVVKQTGSFFSPGVASQIIQCLAMIFKCTLEVQCGTQLLFLVSVAEALSSLQKIRCRNP